MPNFSIMLGSYKIVVRIRVNTFMNDIIKTQVIP